MENVGLGGRTENWSTLVVTRNAFQGELSFDDFVVTQTGYHRP